MSTAKVSLHYQAGTAFNRIYMASSLLQCLATSVHSVCDMSV